MIVHDVIQGTEAWHNVRLGKFTASNFSSLFSKETTVKFQDFINQVVFERLTGEVPESFTSSYMNRGNELEPEARQSYELMKFRKVKEVGFIELNEWCGCSPDGLIGLDGLLEIKCPKYSTLINLHLNKKITSEYYYQMQGQMWVAEREWCDFYVYHPKLKPFLKRVERNEDDIANIKQKISEVVEIAKRRIEYLKTEKVA